MRRRELAGIFLFAAIVQFAFLANISEVLYEGYSVKNTLLSDLGVWEQPSALLFNTSLVIFGILLLMRLGVLAVLRPSQESAPAFTAAAGSPWESWMNILQQGRKIAGAQQQLGVEGRGWNDTKINLGFDLGFMRQADVFARTLDSLLKVR